MKYFALAIVSVFLLSSCSINLSEDKTWKTEQLERETQNDIFKKKLECSKLEPEMRKQLESEERYWRRNIKSALLLNKVLYSTKRRSCLYTSEFNTWLSNSTSTVYTLELTDFLTKEILLSSTCSYLYAWDNWIFASCTDNFRKSVQELE